LAGRAFQATCGNSIFCDRIPWRIMTTFANPDVTGKQLWLMKSEPDVQL
jgi:hypothetical protein